MKKKRLKKAAKRGPLSALGWNRAHVNPSTGADLKGNWVYPDSTAVHKASRMVQKKVFRDTASGVSSARKAGLV